MTSRSEMQASRRFEPYLAGSVMVLLGLLLLVFVLGVVRATLLPALFLVGVGVIFCGLAVWKSKAHVPYEMSPRTTLAYGALALVIGVLWASVSIEATLAGYVLAGALVFFGIVFLTFAKAKPKSA